VKRASGRSLIYFTTPARNHSRLVEQSRPQLPSGFELIAFHFARPLNYPPSWGKAVAKKSYATRLKRMASVSFASFCFFMIKKNWRCILLPYPSS
jgi:hypothetical protein